MNENSAGALRAVCAKVLGSLEEGDNVDVRKHDMDDALRRFQNKCHRNMTPQSLATYKAVQEGGQAVRRLSQRPERLQASCLRTRPYLHRC